VAQDRPAGRAGTIEREWLRETARPGRGMHLVCVGAGTAAGLLQVAQAALVAAVIAAVAAGAADGEADAVPAWMLAALAAVVLGRAGAAWAWERAGASAAARVKQALRTRLYDHVVSLGPGFAAPLGAGALTAAVMEQTDALDGWVARYRPQTVVAVLVPLAILAAVFPVDWLAGTILLLAVPMVPVLMMVIGGAAAAASQEQFQALARMSGHFLDRLQGLVTLKLFGRAEAELRGVEAAAQEFRRRTMSVLRIAFLTSAVLEFFTAVAVALVAIYVGFALLGWISLGPADEMTLGRGLFVLILAPELFQPLRQLSAYYHDRAQAVGAARELRPILEASPPPRPERGPVPPPGPLAVRFDGVTLARPGRGIILDGMDLAVAPGERVALVGPSGSGKTTALAILLGFLAPDRGRATLGGIPVEEMDEATLRRLVGWVGQNPRLFPGTILDNVRLADPDAPDARVQAALALSRVDEFAAALPSGLGTVVGERGFGLSGGQAQRVALARALLRPSALLLLDEPTAGLDAGNERLVLDALGGLPRDRTVLVATHSPAVAAWADRRIRIAGGTAAVEAA
jgi:ATP-binding cassette subfamily C protein CydD